MIHSSIIIVYTYGINCAVLSGKLAMAITGHAMLIDLQCK
jgi:hypothetical protein